MVAHPGHTPIHAFSEFFPHSVFMFIIPRDIRKSAFSFNCRSLLPKDDTLILYPIGVSPDVGIRMFLSYWTALALLEYTAEIHVETPCVSQWLPPVSPVEGKPNCLPSLDILLQTRDVIKILMLFIDTAPCTNPTITVQAMIYLQRVTGSAPLAAQ